MGTLVQPTEEEPGRRRILYPLAIVRLLLLPMKQMYYSLLSGLSYMNRTMPEGSGRNCRIRSRRGVFHLLGLIKDLRRISIFGLGMSHSTEFRVWSVAQTP